MLVIKNPLWHYVFGMNLRKYFFTFILFFPLTFYIFSQEALKSAEEEYYDFLSLQGITSRPYLNYRTLSDSNWTIMEETVRTENEDGSVTEKTTALPHVWQNNYLGKRRFIKGNKKLSWKIYGPDWYNSFNTAAPYGQNDGALWQGRGYNTGLSAGARFEAYGLEATLKPQISFSQNMAFDIMPSNYDSEYGYFWGYSHNIGIDTPQRFGDKPFFTFDWGDTEIRYTWKNLTVGFGTQNVWLGPAYLNPLLHSNNPASYPKLDLGLRRTSVYLPKLGWYLGDVEARIFAGYLSESRYFDKDSSNNHNLINLFSLSYSPPMLKGLSVGFHKVCLSKWNKDSWKYFNPFYDTNESEDQKFSFTVDLISERGGLEVYGEIGVDDTINFPKNTIESYVTHIFHTMTYTVGAKKTFTFSNILSGELIFEWNNTEMSQDMQFQWPYSFGFHHQITQGYTNQGQYLGSGIGYGGNSQYLEFKMYYPQGKSSLFFHRFNPDNNFLFKNAIYDKSTGESGKLHVENWNSFKGIFAVGIQSDYFVRPQILISGGFVYNFIVNPVYNYRPSYEHRHNIQINAAFKYFF